MFKRIGLNFEPQLNCVVFYFGSVAIGTLQRPNSVSAGTWREFWEGLLRSERQSPSHW